MTWEDLGFFHELDNLVLVPGFEEAFIGLASRYDNEDIAVYDQERMIDILINRDDMSREEAWEYFEYNIRSAYYGERTPVYLTKIEMTA